MNAFSFNTAVARLMELLNAMNKYDSLEVKNTAFLKGVMDKLVLLLAPCVPHFAEELWHLRGNEGTVFDVSYPTVDESKLVRDEVEYAIQFNSKIKTKMTLSKSLGKEEIEKAVLASDEVKALLDGKTPKKVIVIPSRLVNLIV